MSDIVHKPVMYREVLDLMTPSRKKSLFFDGNLGEGGHSQALLERFPDISVIGVDVDAGILEIARKRLAPFGSRFTAVNSWFDDFLADWDGYPPDRVLMDLGISVYHYEKSGGGFSFRKDEALDMRLDHNAELSVKDVVLHYSEEELARVFHLYGEERFSRRIASAIAKYRAEKEIETSTELAEIIFQAVPVKFRHGRIHPATKVFQALRIEVNGELSHLEKSLGNAFALLPVGGRLGVISFHSLEDRIVKHFFKEQAKKCICPPEYPRCLCGGEAVGKLITRKPIEAGEDELKDNPPSRSARFRVIEKIGEREGLDD